MLVFSQIFLVGELGSRVGIHLGQGVDLEFVQVNPVGISARMVVDGDQLEEELLNEVQNRPHKDGNDNLVDRSFPAACVRIAIHMVILHRGEKGDLDTQKPEKEGRGQLQLLGDIAPFLRVVGEDTGKYAHRDRKALCNNLVITERIQMSAHMRHTLKSDTEVE